MLFRNCCSVLKKKGSGNKEFHTVTWPVAAAAAKISNELVEMKAKGGVGKIHCKTEQGAKDMQQKIVEALTKAKLKTECSVIVGGRN